MLKLRLLSLLLTAFLASVPVVAGFSGAVKNAAVASLCSNSKTLLTKSPLHLFGDTDRLAHRIDGACAFIENIRGADGKAAYENQDRLAFANLKNALVGLFDGHGKKGGIVATLVQRELIRRVLLSKNPSQSLKEAFADIQNMLSKNPDAQHAGTTAVIGVLDEHDMFTVANVGDSRLIVVRNKELLFATCDHKPTDPIEIERVTRNGGFVYNGRVWSKNGSGFALARSMGDISSQGTALIAEPDISSVQLIKGDTVVLASDGVWDVLSNQQVIELIDEQGSLQDIANRIVKNARDEGSRDDISALVFRMR